jgi:hypothetical protein
MSRLPDWLHGCGENNDEVSEELGPQLRPLRAADKPTEKGKQRTQQNGEHSCRRYSTQKIPAKAASDQNPRTIMATKAIHSARNFRSIAHF